MPKGSPGAGGLVMAAVVGTLLPAVAVLPANLPNVLLMGAAGTLYDVTMQYGSYLLLHLPVTGMLKAIAIVVTTLHVFPATTRGVSQLEKTPPLSRQEWMVSVVLAMTLGLWLSDGWHGIAPAWVGLGAAVFCLLPPIGVVPEEAFGQVNLSSLLYMAGIIGLGSLVATSGLGGFLGDRLLGIIAFEPGNDGYNFAALVGVSPALVLAMERSGVRLTAVLRLLMVLAVLTLVVLTPLNYLWWRLLGYFVPSG